MFRWYVDTCNEYDLVTEDLQEIKLISSDDIFDYLLDLRAINSKVNRRKQALEEEYYNSKNDSYESNLDEYEALKNRVDANRMTVSKYVRTRLRKNNIIEQSNGESALEF